MDRYEKCRACENGDFGRLGKSKCKIDNKPIDVIAALAQSFCEHYEPKVKKWKVIYQAPDGERNTMEVAADTLMKAVVKAQKKLENDAPNQFTVVNAEEIV